MPTDCIFVTGTASEIRVRFSDSKTGLSPKVLPLMLLQFLCFVRLWFHM